MSPRKFRFLASRYKFYTVHTASYVLLLPTTVRKREKNLHYANLAATLQSRYDPGSPTPSRAQLEGAVINTDSSEDILLLPSPEGHLTNSLLILSRIPHSPPSAHPEIAHCPCLPSCWSPCGMLPAPSMFSNIQLKPLPVSNPTLLVILTRILMGGCQNCGPFLTTLNTRCRTIVETQEGTIIFTTTLIWAFK